MPATRKQIQEIEKHYYKLQSAVPRDEWEAYYKATEEQEKTHRDFSAPNGISKNVAVKLLMVTKIYEFILGDNETPRNYKEFFHYSLPNFIAAVIAGKWENKILKLFGEEVFASRVDLRYFLDRFDYVTLNKK